MLKSRLFGAVGIVAVVGGVLVAQTPAGATFEAASVKAHQSADQAFMMVLEPGGRFVATNIPLLLFIRTAYQLQDDQIVGAPGWLNSDRFDIVAKADAGAPLQQLPSMMQALLVDRFRFATHHETRELPVYALVIARSDRTLGPQLRPTACPSANGTASPTLADVDLSPTCAAIKTGLGTLTLRGAPISQVLQYLAPYVSRVLLDRTSLDGRFDLDLAWTPELSPSRTPGPQEPARSNSDGPSIFTAIQEQLGLKLEATTAPADVLVIDHVEHPTPD
jgi:uncharacterized protein (TIGR03435 family)